jgi:hypothetical protein
MIYTGHHKPIIEKLSKHFNCQSNFIEAKNYDEKLDYIHGTKTDEKASYVTADIEERVKYNISPIINKWV